MPLKTLNTLAVAAVLGATCLYGSAPRASRVQRFPVTQAMHVPGAVLTPGNYSIRELDHLADRSILQVESSDGKVHASFVAIPNRAIARPSKAGPVLWTNGVSDESFVRGWAFPSDSVVFEFAYPKADAVTIAKREKTQVPAVDPESEHMQTVADATASRADMEVINLWLLSAEKVGPSGGDPEIKAVRYQAAPSSERKPVAVAPRLPKTASELPWMAMIGLISLSLWGTLRMMRPKLVEASRPDECQTSRNVV